MSAIELDPLACLNADAPHACRRCVEACPEKAIAIPGGGAPVLNGERCVACGLCVAACPTNAWAMNGQRSEGLFRLVMEAASGRATLVVRCERADGHEGVLLPCLALWRPWWLLPLAALGVRRIVALGLTHCGHCPRRHGRTHWQRVQARARAWQGRLSRPLPEIGEEEHPPAESNRQAARRAFLRAGVLELVRAAAEAAAPERGDHPPERTAVVRALARLGPGYGTVESDVWWPFGGLVAHETCTLCGACVEVCPTNALALHRNGHLLLEQRPDACVGCEACVRACEEGAMERTPGVQWPVIAHVRHLPLKIAMREKEEDDA